MSDFQGTKSDRNADGSSAGDKGGMDASAKDTATKRKAPTFVGHNTLEDRRQFQPRGIRLLPTNENH